MASQALLAILFTAILGFSCVHGKATNTANGKTRYLYNVNTYDYRLGVGGKHLNDC